MPLRVSLNTGDLVALFGTVSSVKKTKGAVASGALH